MVNKFYILDNGHMELDQNMVVALSVSGTIEDKEPRCKWTEIPIYCVLINSPTLGWVLYDTGMHPDCINATPEEKLAPYIFNDEQRLVNQLAKVGLKPEDINVVICSHCDSDHFGGLYLFADTADVYVNDEDFAYSLKKVFEVPDPSMVRGSSRSELTVPVKKYHFLPNEDIELAPGITCLFLPGHTHGVTGLMLETENGTYLFPNDTCNTAVNYGPPVRLSAMTYDSLRMRESIEKIRRLQVKHNAEVFFPHDKDQFKTFKKAPEYYD